MKQFKQWIVLFLLCIVLAILTFVMAVDLDYEPLLFACVAHLLVAVFCLIEAFVKP